MSDKTDFNNVTPNSAVNLSHITSELASRARFSNIELERKHLDSANLQSSTEMQAEILLILKKQSEASERESRLNKKRFWINFFIASVAAIAAAISAIVCIAPFVS